MESIFDGAKFGDKFLTRDGRLALYIVPVQRAYLFHRVIIKTGHGIIDAEVTDGGIAQRCPSDFNIVSRYEEPIDEDKLDKVANKECPDKLSEKEQCCYIQGFIEGYYKANDE